MTGKDIAIYAARAADDKQADDIVVYDLHGISDVADYFVIATAQSKLQAKAIVSGIQRGLREQGSRAHGSEGSAESQWFLLDYVDTVVHVFSPTLREYYSLESLWGDAPRLSWQTGEETKPAPKRSAG